MTGPHQEHRSGAASPAAPGGAITVAALPEDASITLLDVREVDEWDLGHAPDALHIPLVELPVRFGELDLDSDIFVICRGGARSARAVGYLQTVGVDAAVVDGGMIEWAAAGRPVIGRDGNPGSI